MSAGRPTLTFLLLLLIPATTRAAERDAAAIEATLQARHMPYGTILDPVFDSPESDRIVGYTRAGDSAIWTGHYLAAECFRYRVTREKEALDAVRLALDGIRRLVDVTGSDVLARALVPVDSPFAAAIVKEEAHNRIYRGAIDGVPYFWIGKTSRDQYLGVFFGLVGAYDFVDDSAVHAISRELIRRLTDKLIADHWIIRMPDGSRGSILLGRPDHQLTILEIARHVDTQRFSKPYQTYARLAPLAAFTIVLDTLDSYRSYFKFNLDEIDLFTLIRLDDSRWRQRVYRTAYATLRRAMGSTNAFFMAIDRAVEGPDPVRDQQAANMLREWLGRPRRDFTVDLRGFYSECGSIRRSCDTVPVWMRVPTDFLWQRSPYQLYGGATGRVESAGIDYLLPYWMARAYGLE
jgi:hypothetical protein